jgi:4a-hydroxytetrahydrobiopterin dehydratase
MSLADQHCQAGAAKLDAATIETLLREVPEWRLAPSNDAITREFRCANFYLTMGFANAVAYLANREDHHPDLALSYGRCAISLNTHDANGLSLNDFILAAQIDRL